MTVKPITNEERDLLSGDGLVPDRFLDLMSAIDAYEARLQQLEAALKPFVEYIDTRAADLLPDNHQMTEGSPLARRQINMADFRRAKRALKGDGE